MSFNFEIDPKDLAVADFVSEVGRALQTALLNRKKRSGLTQQFIAKKLGVDRSRVNRCFSGYSNLTLSSVAELSWALGVVPRIVFEDEEDAEAGCNYRSDTQSKFMSLGRFPVRTEGVADSRINVVNVSEGQSWR